MKNILFAVVLTLICGAAFAQDATLAKPTEPIPSIASIRVTHVVLVRMPEENGFIIRLEFLSADNKLVSGGDVPVKDNPETKDVNEFETFAAGLLVSVNGEPKSDVDKIAFRAIRLLEERKLIAELQK